jgi:sensor histidine kinase YesM
MVTELSKYLRYSLLSKNVSEVLLRDEIEMLKNYLMIEKVRFEDRLEVSFDIEASAEEYRLPALLIQPLVENAIKYGMQTSSMPLKIRIRAYIKEDCFHLEVSNTGKWQEPFEGKEAGATAMHSAGAGVGGTGIGLQNVRERLDHAYGERYRFEIFEWDGWVYAVIEIK